MKIEKKTWPDYFQKVLDGEKNFEIRLADFKCEAGDVLVLREWNPETKKYTGRIVEKEVMNVINTKNIKYWSKEEIKKQGLLIIGLK